MGADAGKKLLDTVNSSGFPFQIGLRKEIERTSGSHGWKADIGEHRWNHRELQESGYIDLVLKHEQYIFTILVECKRMREGNWIFLTPEGSSSNCSRLSAFHTAQGRPQEGKADGSANDACWWDDADFSPDSPEAEFCVMKGQDERNPMLERIADGLLPAVEAVGAEYLTLNSRANYSGENQLFLPVIVTNAELWTATCDPSNISMKNGELEADKCSFASVSSIRFRKSLSTHYPSYLTRSISRKQGGASLVEAAKGNERTILIINSLAVSDTLKELRIPDRMGPSFGHRFTAIANELRRS